MTLVEDGGSYRMSMLHGTQQYTKQGVFRVCGLIVMMRLAREIFDGSADTHAVQFGPRIREIPALGKLKI